MLLREVDREPVEVLEEGRGGAREGREVEVEGTASEAERLGPETTADARGAAAGFVGCTAAK